MKSILIAITLFFTAATAYANGYCDTRPNASEVSRCYQNSINGDKAVMNKNYKTLSTLPKITEKEHQRLKQSQDAWANATNSGCRTAKCLDDSLIARNQILVRDIYIIAARK